MIPAAFNASFWTCLKEENEILWIIQENNLSWNLTKGYFSFDINQETKASMDIGRAFECFANSCAIYELLCSH